MNNVESDVCACKKRGVRTDGAARRAMIRPSLDGRIQRTVERSKIVGRR